MKKLNKICILLGLLTLIQLSCSPRINRSVKYIDKNFKIITYLEEIVYYPDPSRWLIYGSLKIINTSDKPQNIYLDKLFLELNKKLIGDLFFSGYNSILTGLKTIKAKQVYETDNIYWGFETEEEIDKIDIFSYSLIYNHEINN